MAVAIPLLYSCQTVEQVSIDYLMPGDINFPPTLKRVAVVNNVPRMADDGKPLIASQEEKDSQGQLIRLTHFYHGDAAQAAGSLAQSLADENYFDQVIICDSALNQGHTPRRLTQTEVQDLSHNLGADVLVSIESLQLACQRKIGFMPEWGVYYGTVDVKVHPSIRVYLPTRSTPMVTLNSTDSIFWDATGSTESHVLSQLIDEKGMLQQSSEFAGTVPVKQLLPHWRTSRRYLFSGGNVRMRDAAIYVKEKNWPEAVQLWKEEYEARKQGKVKMQAAYNVALGYEMQDSIDTAYQWALQAQNIARQIDGVDKLSGEVNATDLPNYLMTTLYVNELKDRKDGLMRLNMQMKRLNEDF